MGRYSRDFVTLLARVCDFSVFYFYTLLIKLTGVSQISDKSRVTSYGPKG
jgi:hypothetical protein